MYQILGLLPIQTARPTTRFDIEFHIMNEAGVSKIALIIGVLIVIAAGVGYWVWMQTPSTSVTPEIASVTAADQTKSYNERAPLNSTPNNEDPVTHVQILGLTSQSQTVLPILQYRVDSNVSGNGYINLVSKDSGTSIWGMEQEPSGVHSLDLNTLTRLGDSSAIKLPDGDYFLRVQDRAGNLLAESAAFHVAPGIVSN